MIGAYSAHFYCDACNEFSEADQVETASEARQQMRERGWQLTGTGNVFCAACDPKDIRPENLRNGSDWHNYGRR